MKTVIKARVHVLLILGFASLAVPAWAGQKMDLDDISIKGELHNDDRLKMIAREQNQLRNFVKFRTSFRSEIVEGLPKPEPRFVTTDPAD